MSEEARQRPGDYPERTDALLEVLCEMWDDMRLHGLPFRSLDVEKYSRKYRVSKFPRKLAAPALSKGSRPTLDDAEELRTSINAWARIAKCNTYLKGGRDTDDVPAVSERQAIKALKRAGYIVLKRTETYIPV